ncbi:MAG TPA: PEP-CTERM sorting domain-containing protein, partial [Isosphaeraceae bacterium]
LSDAGDSFDLFGINLNFSDSASAFLPDETQITTGTYLPTNYGTTADTFPSPAPGGPFGTSLEALLAGNANGTWSLYIVDDAINDTGSLSGGWQISIANVGSTVVPEPATLASAGLAGLIGLGARWRRRRRAAT